MGGTAFQLYEKGNGEKDNACESKMLKEEIIKAVKAMKIDNKRNWFMGVFLIVFSIASLILRQLQGR